MIKRSTRVTSIKPKKLLDIYDIDVDKLLISKKNLMVKKAYLNTFLHIIMMMSIDLNASSNLLYIKDI